MFCSDILYTNFQQIFKNQLASALNLLDRVVLLKNGHFNDLFVLYFIFNSCSKQTCKTEVFFF